MLTCGIHASYQGRVGAFAGHEAVRTVGRGGDATGPNQAVGALFETDAAHLLADHKLTDEVFGASSLIVRCKDLVEVASVIGKLEGQLTATIQLDPEDEADTAKLLPILAGRVGRILANGWPTGVEVCHAMVHGGPYPATSDTRSTSVGTLAINRFLRPVCFQNLPDALLPEPLRAANPWSVARRLDGKREASPR